MVTDWRQMNSALFEALAVERVAMFVVLSLIILVAAFNIALVADHAGPRQDPRHRDPAHDGREPRGDDEDVHDRRPDHRLARASCSARSWARSSCSSARAWSTAIQALTGQDLWDPSVRFLTELPSKTDPFEVAAIILDRLVLSFLATLFPACKAASTDPVQVLRYE